MDTDTLVGIIYITIQAFIAVFISIIGAIHVKRCIHESNINIYSDLEQSNQLQTDKKEKSEDNESNIVNIDVDTVSEEMVKNTEKMCTYEFWKLWSNTVWKMRSVYGGLAVHSFDVVTDILVIIQWMNASDIENIDHKAMAYSAIAVLIFAKFISTFAIYLKERNIIRCILQIFDLLIFAEIYETHKKVVSNITTKQIKDKNTAIESTLSFKYVRSFEAVFESIPECVLQLVYVIRTSSLETIFILSIIQSIISMTNSILNNDHTQMQEKKWDKYKKRLPPTIHCIKHSVFRLCEVWYRIGLLALLWSVCGGTVFTVFMIFELMILISRLRYLISKGEVQFDGNAVLLTVTSYIIVPSEYFYAYGEKRWHEYARPRSDTNHKRCSVGCFILNCCFCATLCGCIAGWPGIIRVDENAADAPVHFIPLTRICVSFFEFMFMSIWALMSFLHLTFKNELPFISFKPSFEADGKYIFSFDYGAAIFIASICCFLLYTQYLVLFPNFRLPFGVNVRSKWGYALGNELSELKKVKRRRKFPYMIENTSYTVKNDSTFWDEPIEYQGGAAFTIASIALMKGHNHIVKWLEDQGAVAHKHINTKYFMPVTTHHKFALAEKGDLFELRKIQVLRNKKYQGLQSMQYITEEHVLDKIISVVRECLDETEAEDIAMELKVFFFEMSVEIGTEQERMGVHTLLNELRKLKALLFMFNIEDHTSIFEILSDETNSVIDEIFYVSTYGIQVDLRNELMKLRSKGVKIDPIAISGDIRPLNEGLINRMKDGIIESNKAKLYRVCAKLNAKKKVNNKGQLIHFLEDCMTEPFGDFPMEKFCKHSIARLDTDLSEFLLNVRAEQPQEDKNMHNRLYTSDRYREYVHDVNNALLRNDGKTKRSYKVKVNVYIRNMAQFYDEPTAFVESIAMTPAVFALSRGHVGIVQWLEKHGASSHKNIHHNTMKNWDWDKMQDTERNDTTPLRIHEAQL